MNKQRPKMGRSHRHVKNSLIYFEGDFYSKEEIRQILRSRKQRSRKIALRQRKRKTSIFFGLNTTKA